MPSPDTSRLRRIRLTLWGLVSLTALVVIALYYADAGQPDTSNSDVEHAALGGPFTLVDAGGKPFSSSRLNGKPYAIFFGFTRCGDVCPTTLSRLVQLRKQAGEESAFNIVFVTIDPQNDGPREVGQYAQLFNSPIIGLTGSPEQIAAVKKQFGIYAEPEPHAAMGKQFTHTGSVLLFGRDGRLTGTLSGSDSNGEALDKLRKLVA